MPAKKPQPRQAKKRDRSFVGLILIVLMLGVGVIGYIVMRSKPVATVVADTGPLPPAAGHMIGSDSAPVEIVEFGDFECPQCGRFANITEPDVRARLVQTGAARFRFMDYPLDGHPSTLYAHNAAACAGAQGKFWEMHDRVFTGQPDWSALVNGHDMNAPKVMKRYAKELGLDTKAFNACLDTQQFARQIRANFEEGSRQNVGSTPTFFIGKRSIVGAQPYDVIKALVDSATMDVRAAAGTASKEPAKKTPPPTKSK